MAIRNLTAHQFGRTIGINDDAANASSVYSKTGIRRFRMGISGNGSAIKNMGDSGQVPGFDACAFVSAYANDPNNRWSLSSQPQQTAFNTAAPYLAYIEGPNEPNNPGVGGGSYYPSASTTTASPFSKQMYTDWCQAVFDFVKNSASFGTGPYVTGKNIGLVCGPFAGGQAVDSGDPWTYLGSIGAQWLDFGPSHVYPSQCPFRYQSDIDKSGYCLDNIHRALQLVPNKPVVGTEIGHYTAFGFAGDATFESTQAKTLLNAWLGHVAYGNPVMYIFRSTDSNSYANAVSESSDQPYYGIIRSDGTPKPAAKAIKAVLSIAGEHNPNFTPSRYLNITVSGMINSPPEITPTLQVAKSDGSYSIVIWNESKIANMNPYTVSNPGGNPEIETSTSRNQTSDVNVTPNYVTVDFGGQVCNWQLYDPMNPLSVMSSSTPSDVLASNATTPVASGSGATSITAASQTIGLRGYPLVLKLTPVTATAAPGPATLSQTNATATTVDLSWTSATQSPTDYRINVTPSGGTTYIIDTKSGANSYKLVGLKPSTGYSITVTGYNENFGWGTASNAVTPTTSAASGNSVPVFVQSKTSRTNGLGAGSYTFTFNTAPAAGNTVILFVNAWGGDTTTNVGVTGPGTKYGPYQDPDPANGGLSYADEKYAFVTTGDGTSTSFSLNNLYDTYTTVYGVELSGAYSFSVSHGLFSTYSGTSVGWPVPARNNTGCLTYSMIAFPVTPSAYGTPGTGVTLLSHDDTSMPFNGAALASLTPSTVAPTLAITQNDTTYKGSYVNAIAYGASVPTAVTTINTVNRSSVGFSVNWAASSGATAYRVTITGGSYSTETTVASLTTTSYQSPSTLSPSTTYTVKVYASNVAGESTAASTAITTVVAQQLQVVQSGKALKTGGVTGTNASLTVTLPQSTTVGNTLAVWVSMFATNNNLNVVPPSTATNSTGVLRDNGSTSDNLMLFYTDYVATAGTTYTFSGVDENWSMVIAEVQGIISVDTPAHAGNLTYVAATGSESVTIPVTAPSTTPALGLYGVHLTVIPDAYGAPPANVTLLQGITGNSAAAETFHGSALYQVASSVTGNITLPFSLGNAYTQLSSPVYVGVNFVGANVASAPNQVSAVTFASTTSTSMIVNWTAASGTVTSYTLDWRPTGNISWTSITGITGTTATLNSLTADTSYDVRITALNGALASPVSNVFTNRTAATAPGQVTGLALSGTAGATALNVVWAAVTPKTSYTLQYKKSADPTFTTIVGLSTEAYTLQGLTAATAYDIQVFAVNGAVAGTVSTAIHPSTASAPASSGVQYITTYNGQYVLTTSGGLLTTPVAPIVGGKPVYNVSHNYSAAGAIDPTDTFAVVTAASGTLAMTLAAGTVDGMPIIVKRIGAGVVTLTANIDGSSRTVTMNSTRSGESVWLAWNTTAATYYVINYSVPT